MSSERTSRAAIELTDSDLEKFTAGKDGDYPLGIFSPKLWVDAVNPSKWQVLRGKESIDFLQAHNMLYN